MKNKDNLDSKKEKKLNKIKEQLARLREKLASENKIHHFPQSLNLKKLMMKLSKPKHRRKQKRKRLEEKKNQKRK